MDSGTEYPAGHLAGTTVADYKILEPVGVGGMGVVYRGWDDRLGRPVAVKVLHPALATEERSRQRFLRETRLACRVIHPYVATVFDVLEKEERLFLVMEYIEGRRLDEYVAERDPNPKEIARLGLEIAEALAAIHDSGLVHRDLKPGNVMITPAGHVKVMDFGVAYPMRPPALGPGSEGATPAPEPTLTQEGHGVGTVSYMSPEQISGRPVDGRSDLFALGVVLYEALAREHPFMRGSPLATASAILHDAPGSGSEEPKTLTESGALRTIIFRLLEKSPALRYQTSGAVVTDLRAAIEGRPISTRPAAKSLALRISAAAAIVAAAAAGGGWWWTHRAGDATAPPRDRIVVLPFSSTSPGDDDRTAARMVSGLVTVELGSGTKARVLDRDRADEIAAAIAKRGGAPVPQVASFVDARWIVTGEIYREGETRHAAVSVWGSRGTEPVASFHVAAAGTAALADLVTASVGRTVGDQPSRESDLGRALTKSDRAWALAEEARSALRAGRIVEAIDRAERATAEDPAFPEAWRLLAEARHQAGYGRAASEAIEAALRVTAAAPASVPASVAARIAATAARLRDEPAAEIDALRRMVAQAPDDPVAHAATAAVLGDLGRLEEARAEAERACGLDPSDPRPQLVLADVLAALHEKAASQAAFRRADALFERLSSDVGKGEIARARGSIALDAGGFDEAIARFDEARKLFSAAGLPALAVGAAAQMGDADLAAGRFVAAEARYGPALEQFRVFGNRRGIVKTYDAWGAKAYVSGDLAVGERLLRSALETAEGLDNPRLTLYPKVNLANLLMYTGRIGEGAALAREVVARAREFRRPKVEINALNMLADASVQSGRLDEAISLLNDAGAVAEAPGGARDKLPAVRGHLADAYFSAGRLEDALRSVDQAVSLAEEFGSKLRRGYALVVRAPIRSRLGLAADAESDLRVVASLAGDASGPMKDLAPRIAIARSAIAADRGDWSEAQRHAEEAATAARGIDTVGLQVAALVASCHASIELARFQAARERCESALANPRAMAVERVEARALLARALALQGADDAAEAAARRAWDEARRFGTPIPAVEAAAVLSRLKRPPQDVDAIRAEARRLLVAYGESAPPERREAARSIAWIRALSKDIEANAPDPNARMPRAASGP